MSKGGPARDALIANIYGAAAGRQSWDVALELFRQFTRGWMVQLLAIDRRSGGVQFSHAAGQTPEAHLDYVRTYHRIDPRIPLIMDRPLPGWLHCSELIDEQRVAIDPFYQDFLIPYGGRYVTGTKLVDDEELVVILAVLRGVGQPPVEPETVRWMDGLRGHFVEAIANYRHLASLHLERGVGHAILDGLRQPVVLVDASRALLYANAAAREALAATRYVINRNGLLGCRHRDDDAELTAALQSLALAAATPTAASRRHVRLRTADGVGKVLACLAPLRPAEVMGMFGAQPLAMIMFHDTASTTHPDALVIAEVFELTPAEARVAVLLAQGVAADDIARRRQVSTHTVRTQIKAVLAKTEASSLSDLVRRLVSLSTIDG